MILGNRSKDAKTWINGPTHETHNQCLPGYTGFISGIKAENVFATTYAKNTSKSFGNEIPRGFKCASANERYKTLASSKHDQSANRRILDDQRFSPKRDFIEYSVAVNQMHNARKEQIATTSKAKAANIKIIKSKGETDLTVSPKRYKKDMNGSAYNHTNDLLVRPQLLESKVSVHEKFRDLSPGF